MYFQVIIQPSLGMNLFATRRQLSQLRDLFSNLPGLTALIVPLYRVTLTSFMTSCSSPCTQVAVTGIRLSCVPRYIMSELFSVISCLTHSMHISVVNLWRSD